MDSWVNRFKTAKAQRLVRKAQALMIKAAQCEEAVVTYDDWDARRARIYLNGALESLDRISLTTLSK
jgi:hypothetical protein